MAACAFFIADAHNPVQLYTLDVPRNGPCLRGPCPARKDARAPDSGRPRAVEHRPGELVELGNKGYIIKLPISPGLMRQGPTARQEPTGYWDGASENCAAYPRRKVLGEDTLRLTEAEART